MVEAAHIIAEAIGNASVGIGICIIMHGLLS